MSPGRDLELGAGGVKRLEAARDHHRGIADRADVGKLRGSRGNASVGRRREFRGYCKWHRNSGVMAATVIPVIRTLENVVPYVIKTAAMSDLEPGDEVEVTKPYFYGGHTIGGGDEVFLWYSGRVQRLAWFGEVLQVIPIIRRRITVTIRLISQPAQAAPTLADLEPYRDNNDGSILSQLSHKLFYFAHDKIAAISDDEAIFFRTYFT